MAGSLDMFDLIKQSQESAERQRRQKMLDQAKRETKDSSSAEDLLVKMLNMRSKIQERAAQVHEQKVKNSTAEDSVRSEQPISSSKKLTLKELDKLFTSSEQSIIPLVQHERMEQCSSCLRFFDKHELHEMADGYICNGCF